MGQDETNPTLQNSDADHIAAAAQELIHALGNLYHTSDVISLRALQSEPSVKELSHAVKMLRTLWRRANHQVFRFDYVIRASRGEPVPMHAGTVEDLRAVLETAKAESGLIDDRPNALTFEVIWQGPDLDQRPTNLVIDKYLIAEALDNLLDNARKYSFASSTVRLSGGMTPAGEIYLSVQNHGIPISSDDASACTQRGWRGLTARQIAPGDGLGLWIVNSIMQAHGGRLVVTPTDADGINDFRLIFPSHQGAKNHQL